MSAVGGWRVGDYRTIAHEFTLDELSAFAGLTGDYNPLHVDARYAESTPAGGQVVHGMLAASFISTLIGMHIPGEGALWNSFSVEWRKIVRIGDALVFRAEVVGVQKGTQTINLRITGRGSESGALYLTATATVLVMEKKEERSRTMSDVRYVLVTGASGAVGGAIARQLVTLGFRVVAAGRNRSRLEALQGDLGRELCHIEELHLENGEQLAGKIDALAETFPVAGFVHAAAPGMDFIRVDAAENDEALLRHFQVGVMAFQVISRRLVPKMSEGGSVVAILTQAIFDQPPPKVSAYVSAKMACLGLVKAYAAECGPLGVRFNAVSPNMMNTPYTADMPMRAKKVEEAVNPLRRLCLPEDVAETVGFLMSPGASYINGANIPLTGGSKMPV